MKNLNDLMLEPMTRTEIENEIAILNTHIPNSEGKLKEEREAKRDALKKQLDLFINVSHNDIVEVVDTDSHRSFERDTFDISEIEIVSVKPPRTANEILADRHRFSSSLYAVFVDRSINRDSQNADQHPMEAALFGINGVY